MCAKLITFIFLCSGLLKLVNSATTYDQRQTGDFNVQVDLKDLNILAFLNRGKEEYVDYDYAYDYSEMTIKPQNGTTRKPLKVTTNSPNYTTTVKVTVPTSSLVDQTTLATKSSSFSISLSTEGTINPLPNEFSTTNSSLDSVTTTTAKPNFDKVNGTSITISNVTDCKNGFVLNRGDCVFKTQGSTNALQKLVKLSQELKARKEN